MGKYIAGILILMLISVPAFAQRGRADFNDPKQVVIAYDTNDNAQYIGKAIVGKATSVASWQIQKLVYDANGNVINIYFADDSVDFGKIWDNRSTYTYD